MYLAHYGLTEPPFSITPDPRFVFLSERHRDALAHLLFGVDQGGGGGFVQLTGEVGTGKTTLCRVLLEQLPANSRVALVLNPQLTPVELLETICEELRLDLDDGPGGSRRGSLKGLIDLLNRYLLDAYSQGLKVVLIIDEAQNLSIAALEQVRLLTNLETPTQKLLQIILLGQPELRAMLARDDLRQLAQRITARYHLTPLDAVGTAAYLRHRWRVAGGQQFPFTAKAIQRIHHHSGGVPRLINVIAERSLLGGYAHDQVSIGRQWVDRAANEALAPARASRWWRQRMAIAAAASLVLVLAAALLLRQPLSPAATPAHAAASVGPVAMPAKAPDGNVPVREGEALLRHLRAVDASLAPAARQLLTLWELPADEAGVAVIARCIGASTVDIQCARGRASMDALARHGRPALLRLRVDAGDAWALLLGADATRARLRVGAQTFDTDRIALEQLWTGEYTALWRSPAALGTVSAAPLGNGASGPVIDWVSRQLQPAYLPESAERPARVDPALRDAVRRYQRAAGLASDGVIGPETLMAMSSREPGPRLLRALE